LASAVAIFPAPRKPIFSFEAMRVFNIQAGFEEAKRRMTKT